MTADLPGRLRYRADGARSKCSRVYSSSCLSRMSSGSSRGFPVSFFLTDLSKGISFPWRIADRYSYRRKAGESNPARQRSSDLTPSAVHHTASAFRSWWAGDPSGPLPFLAPLGQDPCGLQPGAWPCSHHPSPSSSSSSADSGGSSEGSRSGRRRRYTKDASRHTLALDGLVSVRKVGPPDSRGKGSTAGLLFVSPGDSAIGALHAQLDEMAHRAREALDTLGVEDEHE